MAVTVRALLAELEGLDHHRRVVRMVELGRAARTDPGVRGLLAGMADADWYQRHLAVHAGYGSGDAVAARRAAADASRSVRGVALGLLAHIGDDDLLAELLGGLAGAGQRRFAARLARRGRRRVVDTVVRRLAAGGDPAAVRLLRSTTAETAAALAPALLDTPGWADWHSLAEQHPDVVAAALRQAADGVAAPDQRIASRAGAVLAALGERDPDLALRLLAELDTHLAQPPLQRLALRRPAEVADLVLAATRRTDFPAV